MSTSSLNATLVEHHSHGLPTSRSKTAAHKNAIMPSSPPLLHTTHCPFSFPRLC
jgi:hypothetical protein